VGTHLTPAVQQAVPTAAERVAEQARAFAAISIPAGISE
jgi:hypothetical protein